MAERLNRFLGDTPLRVFIKLAILSLVLGVIMRSFGWSALDVVSGLRNLVMRIWNLGFGAIDRFADYLILGGAIIIPAFLLLRIWAMRKG
jgi:hypothetical protein